MTAVSLASVHVDAHADAVARDAAAGCTATVAFPSRLGWMAVVLVDQRLARLVFGYPTEATALSAAGSSLATGGDPAGANATNLIARLQRLAAGQAQNFDDVTLVDRGLTPFQRAVREHCRRLKWGQTITYGQLAARAGAPQAARAVGNFMARNRVPLIIPCHRVLGAQGHLGGFSAPGALAMKRHLLRMEGTLPRREPE